MISEWDLKFGEHGTIVKLRAYIQTESQSNSSMHVPHIYNTLSSKANINTYGTVCKGLKCL